MWFQVFLYSVCLMVFYPKLWNIYWIDKKFGFLLIFRDYLLPAFSRWTVSFLAAFIVPSCLSYFSEKAGSFWPLHDLIYFPLELKETSGTSVRTNFGHVWKQSDLLACLSMRLQQHNLPAHYDLRWIWWWRKSYLRQNKQRKN